jgi:plastocyanin
MNRRSALQSVGGALAVGLSGCLSSGGGDEPRTVRMVGLEFEPADISIAAGRTVEWINDSEFGHSVTAYERQIPTGATYWASGGFETERAARENMGDGLIDAGGTYRRTFETAGEHPYFCVPHEGSGMTGTVSVQ